MNSTRILKTKILKNEDLEDYDEVIEVIVDLVESQ